MPTHETATVHDLLTYRLMRMVKQPKSDQESQDAQREAAFAASLAALAPRDPIEKMLAAEAMAAHNAAMDTFRRAAQPGMANDKFVRLLAVAEALSRQSERTIKALERRQASVPASNPVAGDGG